MEKEFLNTIDRKAGEITALADTIWENPELAFQEYKSEAALVSYLKSQGFTVEENIAGIPTAFIASFGSGHPEIGFIAEFDALAELSQKSLVPHKEAAPRM